MQQLTGFPGASPFAAQGFGMPTQGFGFPGQGMGVSPFGPMAQGGFGAQFQMMNAMMTMMMGSIMQMLQGLMGLGQGGGGSLSPLANFGGGAGQPAGGLNNFLGGGTPSGGGGGGNGAVGGSAPASGGASNGSAPASGNSGVSADLPQGVNGLTFAKASELVRKGGGEVNPGGRPTVLALRSKTAASATYQDTFVVLKPDGTLQQFSANTRPTTSGQDRAMLKPGAYEISPRWRDGKYNNDAFLVKAKNGNMNVGVGRDSNGDGVYSDQEMNANTSSSLIRLHRGKGDRTSSTGCLNVKDYDSFLSAVGGRDASFNLVLVNLN